MFIVKINEAKTTITYSLPESGRPSLLQQIVVHIRGRALWFKSLDEDMTVAYSDHEYSFRKPTPLTQDPARPVEPAPASLTP
jgi:hypothetical protein